MTPAREALTVLAAIGTGTAGGVFFAFSDFVMQALRRLPDRDGVAAMQAINRAAPTPLFMTALFGTAGLSAMLAVTAASGPDEPGSEPHLVAAALYAGVIVLTVGYHVPRNQGLARLDPAAPGTPAAWRTYARTWTRWNHLRSLGALGASAAYVLSLRGG